MTVGFQQHLSDDVGMVGVTMGICAAQGFKKTVEEWTQTGTLAKFPARRKYEAIATNRMAGMRAFLRVISTCTIPVYGVQVTGYT